MIEKIGACGRSLPQLPTPHHRPERQKRLATKRDTLPAGRQTRALTLTLRRHAMLPNNKHSGIEAASYPEALIKCFDLQGHLRYT